MKILFFVGNEVDYGTDVIYDGLCRILGCENVLEYPERPTWHSKKVGRSLRYPCLFDYPVVKTEEDKIGMLKNNEFDCIFASCRVEEPGKINPRYGSEFYELLKEKSKIIPTIIIDQGDRSGILDKIRAELNCRLYFKREHLGETSAIPLNFAYSEKYIPENINTERTIPIFWAGMWNSYRKKYLNACENLSRNIFSQEDYRKRLLGAKIGLSLRGFGFDTVRYYEIPAHGALLFAEKVPITIQNNFMDGDTAVFFESEEELKDKLGYLLNNPEYADKIRIKGHEWLKKYHTGAVRASQILEHIKLNNIL